VNTLMSAQVAQTMPGLALADFGMQANAAAAQAVFRLYQERQPSNTQRAQRAALANFAAFMREGSIAAPGLYSDPMAWSGITWGLVQGFQQWLLQQGYAVKSCNDKVSVVRTYMALANQAGAVPDGEILRLRTIRGFTRRESIDLDERRTKNEIPTRRGKKKESATQISDEQARQLCRSNNTPQGRRDAVIMCLLLDHGLRVSELASLTAENVNLETKQLAWWRGKTGTDSKHTLRGRALRAMIEYLRVDHRGQSESLLLASNKSGALLPGSRMSIEAIRQRAGQLGREIGLETLSPHDCRHFGASQAGRDPTVSLAGLMHWGGWESATSAARYIDRGQADNDGVALGAD
jgi:integrase